MFRARRSRCSRGCQGNADRHRGRTHLDAEPSRRFPSAAVELVRDLLVEADVELLAPLDVHERRFRDLPRDGSGQCPRPLPGASGGDDPISSMPSSGRASGNAARSPITLPTLPINTQLAFPLNHRSPSTRMVVRARGARRWFDSRPDVPIRPNRFFDLPSASRIMRGVETRAGHDREVFAVDASDIEPPAFAVQAEVDCGANVLWNAEICGEEVGGTRRHDGHIGRRIRRGRRCNRCTIPSPPQTKMRSAPRASALRTCLGASFDFGTSNHSGSDTPDAARTERSSGSPPSSCFSRMCDHRNRRHRICPPRPAPMFRFCFTGARAASNPMFTKPDVTSSGPAVQRKSSPPELLGPESVGADGTSPAIVTRSTRRSTVVDARSTGPRCAVRTVVPERDAVGLPFEPDGELRPARSDRTADRADAGSRGR